MFMNKVDIQLETLSAALLRVWVGKIQLLTKILSPALHMQTTQCLSCKCTGGGGTGEGRAGGRQPGPQADSGRSPGPDRQAGGAGRPWRRGPCRRPGGFLLFKMKSI